MPQKLYKTIGGKRIEKTPEEIAEQERQGQEIIRERERKTGILTPVLGGERTAREQAMKEISQEEETKSQKQEEITTKTAMQQEILKATEPISQPLSLSQFLESEKEGQTIINESGEKIFIPSGALSLGQRTESGIMQTQEKGTIPSELAIPLVTGNIAAGTVAGGLGAVAAGTTAATGTRIPLILDKIKNTSLLSKVFSVKGLASAGGLGFLVKTKANEANSILSSSISEMEEINKEVAANQMTFTLAREQYNIILQNINSAENSLNSWSKLDVFKFLGLKDNLVKFEIARRTTIPNLLQELELARQTALVSNIKKRYGQNETEQ